MKVKGFGLVEVLIGSFVVSVGLLSMAGVQSIAVKSIVETEQRALADSLLVDITERMKLNQAWLSVPANNYDVESLLSTDVSAPDCADNHHILSNCSGEDLRDNDLFEWKQKLLSSHVLSAGDEMGLVGADACIEKQTSGIVIVVLSWQTTMKRLDAADGEATSSIRYKCGTAGDYRRQVSIESYMGVG